MQKKKLPIVCGACKLATSLAACGSEVWSVNATGNSVEKRQSKSDLTEETGAV